MKYHVLGIALLAAGCAAAAPLPGDWPYAQHFQAPAAGLVKLGLPAETLDRARPGLEDLRLCDDAGRELPYALERPAPAAKIVRDAKSFRVTLSPAATAITLETGLAQALDAVTLESPAASFVKSARIEGSADGQSWRTLAEGQPLFRQSGGARQLQLAVPAGVWPWLRLTVDDQRSGPVPFSGARVHAAAVEPAPSELVAVTLGERYENPGETRLALRLGAANLTIANIYIDTPEALFTRQARLAVLQVSEESVREQTVAQGTIYRVALEGQPVSTNLAVPLETQVRARELLLLINNQDSPPLPVTAVRAERRPVYLVFFARAAGPHHLLTGNSRCAAPRYDLASLGANLKAVPLSPVQLSPPADNPNYRPPEVLPGLQEQGAALEVKAWKFRKAIRLAGAGAHQLELDLDVLAHTASGFPDLRLLREGKQWPYLLERTSISRLLTPLVTVTNDAKDPKLSRWVLKLSHPGLPITRVSCRAHTPLFRRDLTLWEEQADDRGETYRAALGSATWVQTLERTGQEFILTLDRPPRQDTLILETHNGDNPPLVLDQFQVAYPATRMLFKAGAAGPLYLYYGNPLAGAPRYDLSLVAGQLLAADKTPAALAGEERLKKAGWGEGQEAGKGGLLFWGILALVVVTLLGVISRLVPKPPPDAKG